MKMKRTVMIGMVVSLLLTAAGGILTSRVESSGGETSLLVLPDSVNYTSPAYGEIFTINVTVANVTNLFGYEFTLSWNTTLLDCPKADVTPPEDWGDDYIVAVDDINETAGQYWLGVVALAPNASSFTGNASLATLTFKVTFDPIYPENVSSPLHLLVGSILVDENADPITHTTYDGLYECSSLLPVIKVLPSEYIATIGGITFEVEVWVFNVSNLARFTFCLTYNATFLNASVPKIGTIFPYPYQHATSKSVIDSLGVLQVTEHTHFPASGSGLLGTLTFTTRTLPEESSCYLLLLITELQTKQNVSIPHTAFSGLYRYIPLPGDVNGDCVVNMQDIYIMIKAYGSEPGDPNWNPLADLNGDNVVNMLDLAKVATNFGDSA